MTLTQQPISSAAPGPSLPGHAAPGANLVGSYPAVGAVAAPGAMAYGATAVPYAVNGTAFGSGMGGSRPVPELVSIAPENPATNDVQRDLGGVRSLGVMRTKP